MRVYVLLRARVFKCTVMLRRRAPARKSKQLYIRIFVFVFRSFSFGPRPAVFFDCPLEAVGFCVFLVVPLSPLAGGSEGRFYI